MDIQLPLASLLPQRPEIKGLPRLIAELRPGREIVVVVDSQLSDNDYLLRLTNNGLQLRARTPQTLLPGQTLQLRVEQGGETPRLKIVAATPPESPAAQAVQQATRAFLPKSLPVQSALNSLPFPMVRPDTTASTPPALPPAVSQALEQLAQSLPPAKTLMNAEGLQRAVQSSGLLFEARAAAMPAALTVMAKTDFKARLMAVATLLQQQVEALEDEGDGPASEVAEGGASEAEAAPVYDRIRPTPGRQGAGTGLLMPSAQQAETTPKGQPDAPSSPFAGAQPEVVAPRATKLASPAAPTEPPAGDKRPVAIYAEIEEIPSVVIEVGQDVSDEVALLTGPPDDRGMAEGPVQPAREGVKTLPDAEPSASLARLGQPDSPIPVAKSPVYPSDAAQTPVLDEDGRALAELARDLKAVLHKVEGGLATIVLAQLSSLPQPQEQGQQVWQFEVPYFTGQGTDVAQFKVTRDGRNDAETSQAFWSVNLQLHPPGLGSLNARITLVNGRIDSCFWSDRPMTTRLIGRHLDLLEARMQHAGLAVGRLEALPDAPPERPEGRPDADSRLLDEKV